MARNLTSSRRPSPPTTKVCLRCGEAKQVAEFPDATRNTCRECKARRARQRRDASRAPADHEPRPATRTRDRGYTLIPCAEAADADARRSLLARLRANGVEVEKRDGRELTVLRLPSIEPDLVSLAPKIEPRRARAARVA